jgi:hypothetical protein
VTRADLLLAFIGASPDAVDPIRIMKGMFLFAQESGAPQRLLYNFVPYSYGPCSFDIYSDLNDLVGQRFLQENPTASGRWALYSCTDAGLSRVAKFSSESPKLFRKLTEGRKYVVSRDFRTLLKEVYAKYPLFASKSVFKG